VVVKALFQITCFAIGCNGLICSLSLARVESQSTRYSYQNLRRRHALADVTREKCMKQQAWLVFECDSVLPYQTHSALNAKIYNPSQVSYLVLHPSQACTSQACTSWACTSWSVPHGVYLMGVYLMACTSWRVPHGSVPKLVNSVGQFSSRRG
jgi:hypothetical protein